jgi:hypothetical protein
MSITLKEYMEIERVDPNEPLDFYFPRSGEGEQRLSSTKRRRLEEELDEYEEDL